MTASRLIVWRHGRTEWNLTNRFQGQADIPLDELGQSQATEAAVILAGYRPAQIWTSDLLRATQTAQRLFDLTGVPLQPEKRLREIHVGSWEGLTGEEVRAQDPELWRRLQSGEDVRRSATGETVSEVGQRAAEAFGDLVSSANDGETVVAVMHGLSGRTGVASYIGLPFEQWRLLGSLDNCGWAILARHRGGGFWRLEEYNVVASPRAEAIS